MNESRPAPARWAAVIGASAGGHRALVEVLGQIPGDCPLAVFVAQHLHHDDDGRFAANLDRQIALEVAEAEDKTAAVPSRVVVAPANYHLLVERDRTLALSVDERVQWSRPSIDVLFESAARVWREDLVAVLLSGANSDGTHGMGVVREFGGVCLVQDPSTAASPTMPASAVDAGVADCVLPPAAIGEALQRFAQGGAEAVRGSESPHGLGCRRCSIGPDEGGEGGDG
jgi:two-component system chemotaxis response regulator CheB